MFITKIIDPIKMRKILIRFGFKFGAALIEYRSKNPFKTEGKITGVIVYYFTGYIVTFWPGK